MNEEVGSETFSVSIAKSYSDGVNMLNDSYDAIIVDIKLDIPNGGNDIIKQIINYYRLPVAVMTGTPDTDIDDDSPIIVYKKGDDTYESIIKSLIQVTSTGLFDVFGRVGIIENEMNKIFWKNLYPKISMWIEMKNGGYETDKIILRYALSHIHELIDSNLPTYTTEEMYIKPPLFNEIKSGSVYKVSEEDAFFIVLSPPCDLVYRNGKIKTDRILLCEIENHDDTSKYITRNSPNREKKTQMIKEAIRNNYSGYYHWLPPNSIFGGGYINFRKVTTCDPHLFDEKYGTPYLKVQEYFVKNILYRFSAFYARQGQPDFNFSEEAKNIVDRLVSLEIKV
jgi:hypothetical protein